MKRRRDGRRQPLFADKKREMNWSILLQEAKKWEKRHMKKRNRWRECRSLKVCKKKIDQKLRLRYILGGL